ncbi:MAG: hypothetical protein HC906_14430 [Bacteroidales bacterium]|nr:hypothetical protein [Bacteroidales bacterium]
MLIHYNDQYFKIFGKISDNENDELVAEFSRFDLGHINSLWRYAGFKFNGILNGKAYISHFYSNPHFFSELKVDSFKINDEKLGDVVVNSVWDNEEKAISLQAFAKRGNLKTISIEGEYFPYKNGLLNFDISLEKLRLNLFDPYIQSLASNLKGLASGDLKVLGTLKKPLFNGDLNLQKTSFTVNYLKTPYFLTHKVNIRDNNILLNDLTVIDQFGNKSTVNGSVTHNFFRNFKFNIAINANRFQFLNTQIADNSDFYGTAYATGLVQIQGSPKNITMDIKAKSERDTRIFIPLSGQEQITEYDFISFYRPGQDEEKETGNGNYKVNLSGIQMNFDFEVTPDAEIQLIFDPAVGDIIRGRGNGNLKMQISTLGKFSMFGNYVVEEGDYRFTLMNFINRSFDIDPGGEITWTGSPYDANMNIKAIYETKTSLNNLFGSIGADESTGSNTSTVQCIISMTENLMSPKIKFDIELPNAEEEWKEKVKNEISTNEDLNKQFLALLVTGKFVPSNQEGFESSPYSSVANGNASEFLSNQLSHWLSQINNNVDISVNLRNDNQLKRNDVEMALSTQLFNDKLTFYGNVDYQTSNTNNKVQSSSKLVGDVELDYKINKSGKLRIKAFHHSKDDLSMSYIEGKPYTQGVGFVYKEEFNTLGELWRRYWNSFNKVEDKEEVNNN